jgi:hypothetical protein
MRKKYILYGTSGCHLCDEAESIITTAIKSDDITYIKQDIDEVADLLDQYALSIPVFKCLTSNEELHWPFTEETVKLLIRQ